MELTLKQLVNAGATINALAKKHPKNYKNMYWLTLAQRKLTEFLETYDATRRALLLKYGTEDADGVKLATPESRQKFSQEIEALLVDKVEVSLYPCPMLRLVEDEALGITPEDLTLLGPLVTLEEPAENT
jgi:hypothetical protein